MLQTKLAPLAIACRCVLLAALVAGAADADAKGRRSGGSSTSSKADSKKEAPPRQATIVIRRSSSSSSSGSTAMPFVQDGLVPIAPAAAAEPDPEEPARRAARDAAIEQAQLEKAAAARAAFEKAEADRLAGEKAAAERAAQRAAEEKAEAARLAAAQEKKRREDAVSAADVDRVLQRAISDYPVLKTPEGEPVLQAILERQKVIQARGVYPSIAMVEAVADHAHVLAPRQKAEAKPVAQAVATEDDAKAFGGCRWITPSRWGCNK